MTEIVDNNNTGELTVLKVYELAADAGKECQQLIERFGQDSASTVTLKIISILEHLELLVNEKTELEHRFGKLSEDANVCHSELERKTDEYNHLLDDVHKLKDQHLEDLEQWKGLLSKARNENKELKRHLNEREGQVFQEKVQEQETVKVLLKLKETVDKQRDEIRAKDSELRSRNQDIEALQQQVERLARVNGNLRRKHEVMDNHSRHLIREKSHLQSNVMALNKDLSKKQRIRTQQTTATDESQAEKDDQKGGADEDEVAFDPKDPNRPRFTLEELRKVLIERDEMHLKVVALEEELEAFRGEEDQTDGPANVSAPSPRDDIFFTFGFANLFKGNKNKTDDVEEELKKWEFLDFDTSAFNADSDGDRQSVDVDTGEPDIREPKEPTGRGVSRRRHSEGAQSLEFVGAQGLDKDKAVLNPVGKNDSWVANLRKLPGSSKEMVEISSPQRPQTAPLSPLNRIRSTSLQEIPPPRSTPPPIRPGSSDEEEVEEGDSEGSRKGPEGRKKLTIPFMKIDTSLLPIEDFMYSPY